MKVCLRAGKTTAMSIETLIKVLGWCSLINLGILVYWFLIIVFASDLVHRFHSKMFKNIERADFDRFMYMGMLSYKMIVFVFNVIPYVSLRIVM